MLPFLTYYSISAFLPYPTTAIDYTIYHITDYTMNPRKHFKTYYATYCTLYLLCTLLCTELYARLYTTIKHYTLLYFALQSNAILYKCHVWKSVTKSILANIIHTQMKLCFTMPCCICCSADILLQTLRCCMSYATVDMLG